MRVSIRRGGRHRLMLRGVSSRARYTTNKGRTGTMSLKRLHRLVFRRGTPPTGMLHLAGHELSFTLTKPRYNAARRTASYHATPLGKPLSGNAARAARRFGPAS